MAAVADGAPAVADDNSAPVTDTQTGDAVTVFHNPDDFNVKHPLMHEWTLWFTKPPSGKVWNLDG
jgi:translation initiation factor 4E